MLDLNLNSKQNFLDKDIPCYKIEPIVDYETCKPVMYEILYNNLIPNKVLFSKVNTTLDLYVFSQLFNWYFKHKKSDNCIFTINCFFETYYLHNSYFNRILRICNNLYYELTEISNWNNYSLNNYSAINPSRVILDDFGTNNHNFDKLIINVYAIKLDRIFLDYSTLFLKELINYLKSKNIKIIFEKIETESELEKVRDCGCNLIQGFINKKIINFN